MGSRPSLYCAPAPETACDCQIDVNRRAPADIRLLRARRAPTQKMRVSFLTHKETERDKRVLAYLDEKIRELAGLPAKASRGPRKDGP